MTVKHRWRSLSSTLKRSPNQSVHGASQRRNSSSSKTLLFVCGGTGGHIFPAVAVAEQVVELHDNRDNIDIIFMGADERDGTGGYVSLPACAAAFICLSPLYLCEPNVVPGVANKLLAPLARRVFVSPACITTKFPKDRKEFDNAGRAAARAALGIADGTLLLTVVGGSLGSVEVSEAVQRCSPELLRRFSRLEIHAQLRAGPDTEGEDTKPLPFHTTLDMDTKGRFQKTEFFKDMAQQLAASDIVLSRAGAGTCAELLQMRVPSVLWPLATATDEHQLRNAEWMEKLGVSLLFRPAADSCVARGITEVLTGIICDANIRGSMRKRAKSTADRVQASTHIARVLLGALKSTQA